MGTDVLTENQSSLEETIKNETNGKAPQEKGEQVSPQAEDKKLSVMEAHGYLLGTVLGSGSYATVKIAFSSRHKCKVAVKIISKRRSPPSYVNKFLPREIDAVRIIKHPNVVSFYQSIETTSRVYLIMEVADGADVLKAIVNSKYIVEEKAGKWFGQCVGAIDYCHQKGVVHRDLKCENLLLDKDENIKVTDFGFARVYDMTQKMDPSETFCGSYPYASPEILRGIAYHPPSCDIWSLGIILFTMVFGRLPFEDNNHRTLVKQVLRGPEFPSRHTFQTKVSEPCRNLIVKILKPLPDRAEFDDIKREAWFESHCAGSIREKKPADDTDSVMEVIKEESMVTDSEDMVR